MAFPSMSGTGKDVYKRQYQNTVKLEDCYACRVVALEMDSLSEKYWNKYSVKFFKEVEEMSARPAQLLLIGENYDDEDCCTCKSPSHYVLQTNMASALPPVCCGAVSYTNLLENMWLWRGVIPLTSWLFIFWCSS